MMRIVIIFRKVCLGMCQHEIYYHVVTISFHILAVDTNTKLRSSRMSKRKPSTESQACFFMLLHLLSHLSLKTIFINEGTRS